MLDYKRLRIGNDYKIRWRILTQDNLPMELSGRNLVLYLENGEDSVLRDFSVDGNEVSFTFYGKDQRALGLYRLVLVENGGESGMRTVDSCRAFSLVGCSCESDNMEEGTEEIVIERTTSIVVGVPGENGASAYEEWQKLGHTGTEADFVEWLRRPAEDAASGASDAARKAEEAAGNARDAASAANAVAEQAETAEKERSRNEEERKIAEKARKTAESGRDASEHLRQEGERGRAAAEQKRGSAESVRENAEQDREKKFSELSAASVSATGAANAAADEARKAASVRFEINMETGEVYAITEE